MFTEHLVKLHLDNIRNPDCYYICINYNNNSSWPASNGGGGGCVNGHSSSCLAGRTLPTSSSLNRCRLCCHRMLSRKLCSGHYKHKVK